MKTFAPITLAALLLTGCASLGMSRIDIGMTEQQVRQIMGKPHKTRANGCGYGNYCIRRYYYGGRSIKFVNGRVDSY